MTYTRRPGPPPAPKPYAFVELPESRRIERRAPIGHEAQRGGLLTGRIELELEALSPGGYRAESAGS